MKYAMITAVMVIAMNTAARMMITMMMMMVMTMMTMMVVQSGAQVCPSCSRTLERPSRSINEPHYKRAFPHSVASIWCSTCLARSLLPILFW